MGKKAVYRLGYFLTIVFSLFFLGLSAYAYLAGLITPEKSMFTAYLTLGYPLLVIINVLLLIYWVCRWKRWAFIPLLGLAVCYPYITSMWKPFAHGEDAGAKTLKVLTYNTHSFGGEITGFSAKEFSDMANAKDVDIICFQEYAGNGDFTNEDICQTYAKFLPYYYTPENYSMAIFSRYPIQQSQVIEFPETNNCAVWSDINVEGTTIRVFNVHMQTTSFDRMRSKAARARAIDNEEGAKQIYINYTDNLEANVIERCRQSRLVRGVVSATEYPVILCGDFNDTPYTYAYRTLRGDLEDGFQSAGSGYASTYRGLHNLLRIDYIFHSPSLEGVEYETIDYEMSDHNPVVMTLNVKE